MKITSWDANMFLCLIEWGLPEDVVKRMWKVAKKIHEDFSLDQAFSYWNTNSPELVRWRVSQPLERRGVSLKFQINGTLEFPQIRIHFFKMRNNMTKEFKREWRYRSIEERQKKVVDWCRFGDDLEQDRHQKRLTIQREATSSLALARLRYKEKQEYVKNLWKSWEACASSYYLVGWDRRVYASRWYEGIHPGRFFLFYKENKIIEERHKGIPKGPCKDGYNFPKTPIFNWGPYEQLIEDLKCLDGGGLGENVGKTVEHIDDIFI